MKHPNDKNDYIVLLDKIFDLIKEHTTSDQNGSLDFAVQFFAGFCIAVSKEGHEIFIFDEAVRQARIYVEVFQSVALTEKNDERGAIFNQMLDFVRDRVAMKGENVAVLCQDLN